MIDYATVLANTSGAFPNILAVNVSAAGAGDGTEFVAALVNDIWGRAQALMSRAGLTPDGVTEAPDTAQIISAISRGFNVGAGFGVTYWKTGTPNDNGDRVLLLQGQVIEISAYADLVDATYVGDSDNATAPAFYKVSDSGGLTRSTTGTHFKLPDHRGLSPKMIGNATINGRTKTGPTAKGEMQEDQMQQITGDFVAATRAPSFHGAIVSYTTLTDDEHNGGNSDFNRKYSFDSAGSPNARTGTNTRDSSMATLFGIGY